MVPTKNNNIESIAVAPAPTQTTTSDRKAPASVGWRSLFPSMKAKTTEITTFTTSDTTESTTLTPPTTSKLLLDAVTHASRIMGRHVLTSSSSSIRIDWPGVRLDFAGPFSNTTSLSIRMNGNGATFGYRLTTTTLPPEKGEYINAVNDDDDDDATFVIFTPLGTKTTKDYPLLCLDDGTPNLDPNKSYRLSIWKRDDPYKGGSTIMGLVVDDACTCASNSNSNDETAKRTAINNTQFLESNNNRRDNPSSQRRKMIEFVGDSNTVGLGITAATSGFIYHWLCQMPCLDYLKAPTKLVQTCDVTKAWAHTVAKQLKCDYHIVAWSGIGARNSVMVEGNTNMTQAYSRLIASDPATDIAVGGAAAGGSGDDTEQIPQLGPTPDAVVIYIGQNDTVSVSNPDQLQESFVTLLQKIRTYRPAPIPIIVIAPSPDTKLAAALSESANRKTATTLNQVWKVVVERQQISDEAEMITKRTDTETAPAGQIYTHIMEANHDPALPSIRSKDDYGMIYHWNRNANDKWARGVLPKLQQLLPWI